MSREEWIKKHSSQAPTIPDEVLASALAKFGVKIKK